MLLSMEAIGVNIERVGLRRWVSLLSKYEDPSLNPQTLCKARHLRFYNLSAPWVRWDGRPSGGTGVN